MQFRIHNEGWVYFLISCLITIVIIPFYTILGILLCILSAYIFYFFRDPIRAIPKDDVIVSPADGLVTFIGNEKSPLKNSLVFMPPPIVANDYKSFYFPMHHVFQ